MTVYAGSVQTRPLPQRLCGHCVPCYVGVRGVLEIVRPYRPQDCNRVICTADRVRSYIAWSTACRVMYPRSCGGSFLVVSLGDGGLTGVTCIVFPKPCETSRAL